MVDKTNKTEILLDRYSCQKISANFLFNSPTITKPDIKILSTQANNYSTHSLSQIPLKDLNSSIQTFINSLKQPTQRIRTTNVQISSNKAPSSKNSLLLNTSFTYNHLFLSPFDFGYLLKPNCYYAKLNYLYYNNRFNQINKNKFLNGSEINCGINYNNIKSKHTYFLNALLTSNEDKYEIGTGIKFSTNDIRNESGFKLNIIRNLNYNNKSFIFKDYLPFDPIKRINFQFSQKSLNCINELSKSTSLIPEHDSHIKGKIVYENFSMNNKDVIRHYHLKISNAVVYSLNSLYLRTRGYLKKTFDYGKDWTYRLCCEVGNVKSLSKQKEEEFNVNEKLSVFNFPGVNNNNNNGNECVFYFITRNKVYYNKLPFCNKYSLDKDGFEIKPFIQLNTLLNKHFHFSSGIGVNFISRVFAFEFNLIPFKKSKNNQISSKCSFSLGFD